MITRAEVLEHYYLEEGPEAYGITHVLYFLEGGMIVTIFEYQGEREALSLWEEDALFHWMKVLKRTWEDE